MRTALHTPSSHAALRRRLLALLATVGLSRPAPAATPQAGTKQRIGIVLLHGIGADGSSMAPLAAKLREPGWLVATPDMPWSQAGAFSVPVAQAERTVRDALQKLRDQGAQKLVLAGFSIGGFFAARMSGLVPADALVAIAPNGGSDMKKLDDQLAKARELVAQGKGQERVDLQDADVTSDARWPLPNTRPATYIEWYDPQGAMNWDRTWKSLRPGVPVLLVVPTKDLANLRKRKKELWESLPPHPANRLLEPRSDHVGAPMASADAIVQWLPPALL